MLLNSLYTEHLTFPTRDLRKRISLPNQLKSQVLYSLFYLDLPKKTWKDQNFTRGRVRNLQSILIKTNNHKYKHHCPISKKSEIHRSINELRKEKPCINILTKSPSKIIVPMNNNNSCHHLVIMSLTSTELLNINTIESEDIMTSYLLQSKFYCKIIGISYIMENTNIPVKFSIIESHLCIYSIMYPSLPN